MTDELAMRTATADDWPGVSGLMRTVFLSGSDNEREEVDRAVFEPERSLVVTDGDAIVGHAGAFTRELTVPGAVLPAAHVTLVGVAPTHRRRRLLTRMMHRQLADVTEPIAVLWASEGRIYPRFGYGHATQRVSFSLDNREVRLPEGTGTGRLRTGDPAQLRSELRRVYESVRPTRPGWSGRNEQWWDFVLADPPGGRHGATALRAVLHEGPDGVDGYALWRAKGEWAAGGPNGEVKAEEIVAANPRAHLDLWRFLLSIDLTRTVSMWFSGLDDPLLYAANEPRRLGTALTDGLFVRIVDLPAALGARRYAAPVEVVLEVTDALLTRNAGRWKLAADGEKASCTPTDEPADLACDVAALGAAYLGGPRLAALAGADRVRELRPGSLAAASTAFGWHSAPAGIEIF